MSIQYRFHSRAFGLHLEKLANGLIFPLINAINQAAKVRGQYAYYAVCTIKEGWPKKKCFYITIYNDSFDVDENRLKSIFNEAYCEVFHLNNLTTDVKISLKFSDYYLDEHNQYCKDIIIGDEFFYLHHNDAIKWHFGR